MHMIPPAKSFVGYIDLPDGPQVLAATLYGGGAPPEAVRRGVLEWMSIVQRPVTTAAAAIEAIAWTKGLPELERIVAPSEWRALCALLISLASEVALADLQSRPLVHQLLAAELALTLAVSLPDDKARRRMEKAGRAAATLGLGRVLDSQGVPAAEHFHLMRPAVGLLDSLQDPGGGSDRCGMGSACATAF